MITQPRAHLSIASPSEIEHTAHQLMMIREGFMISGEMQGNLLWTPRSLILASWQRCRSLQVNPSRRCAPLAVKHEAHLQQVREENAPLIAATRLIMQHLTDLFADSGYVIVLTDAQGCLLDVVGDAGIRRRLAHIDFVPGGNWSEAAAGTNAIGTALADGHIVQLMAAEHYCDGWQDLTCTATPIRHPITTAIVGVLDVTGNYRLIRPFLTTVLATAALEIQQQMLLQMAPVQKKGTGEILIPTDNELRSSKAQSVGEEVILTHPANDASASSATHSGRMQGGPQFEFAHVVTHMASTLQPLGNTMHDAYQWNTSHDETPAIPRLSTVPNDYLQRTQQERKIYDAESLAEAAGAISASLDLPLTLEKVVEHTAHLLHVEKVGVYLFDEHDGIASLHVSSRKVASNGAHVSSEPLVPSALLASLLKRAMAISLIRERGEPVIIDDAHASPLLPRAFIEQMDIGSIALLPLVTARGVIGFITVSRSTAYHWLVDDIRLGLALATQSATAIENARLFATLQQHNRHIEALNTVAYILSTLPNLSQHLDSVLRRITEIMHLETGIILLLDMSKDQLTLASHCGLPRGVSLDLVSHPLKTLQPLIYGVIASGEPFSLSVARHADEMVCESLRHIGCSNVMAVPLTTSGTVLGVLLVGNNSSEDFADGDLKLFSTIGQQLGLALKNAQLLRSTSEMEALREADRLKSSFLAAVSHDLRSPLTAIRASIESLLDADGIQSAQIQEHLLYNIAGQTNRLDQLVEQLLDLSRIEAGALALDCDWTELPVLIRDTATKFERLHTPYSDCQRTDVLASSGSREGSNPYSDSQQTDVPGRATGSRKGSTHSSIECVFADHLPLHYVDPNRLAQVLWNLLENAHKYADPCFPIRIETHLLGNEVHIRVADRCVGIPEEEHEKIFQRFYRLNKDRQSHTKGTGLGLSICRGIVEAHRGRMWVEDRVGGGCVFVIALPLPTADLTGFDASEELLTHPANALTR